MSKGFVTFAQNTDTVDYLRLAYCQALNIKSLHPTAKYAVICDKNTILKIEEKHKKVFDHIIELPYDENHPDSNWKLANEYQVFFLTPFKETIKLESDLLFTRNIDHWWTAFRLRDIVLSTGCKTYRQELATSRLYRKFFDDNELPDVYNGLMYFRYSKTANHFFVTAKQVLQNWPTLRDTVFKNCREDTPSTDVLYAITAKIIGVENCTIPSMDFLNFVHLKPGLNGWGNTDQSWQDIVIHYRDKHMINVHNLNQYHPVHYYDKLYVTEELLNEYERAYFNN